ncbi:unnamed protein product [Amoebophrya sp. A120]|nr:unnamed protein product [Amoebophrya sp. A120]|eukprot:GSA120T00017419001.1
MLRGHFVGCRAVVRALRVFASLAAVAFAASSKVTGGSNTEDDGPKTEVVSLDRKDFVEIFMGVADGFGLDLVEACVKSDVAFEQNIKAAVLEFKKDTEAGMKTALKYLADAFEKDLPSAVKECKGTYDQVQAVLESIASFASPTSFAYHVGKELLVNGVDIFENIKTAVTSWQQEDYHFFGVSVGHALKDVILGVKLDPEDAVSLMQGVVSGLTDTEVTATCVSSSEKLVQDLQKIANALEKNTRAGMAEAMYEMQAAAVHSGGADVAGGEQELRRFQGGPGSDQGEAGELQDGQGADRTPGHGPDQQRGRYRGGRQGGPRRIPGGAVGGLRSRPGQGSAPAVDRRDLVEDERCRGYNEQGAGGRGRPAAQGKRNSGRVVECCEEQLCHPGPQQPGGAVHLRGCSLIFVFHSSVRRNANDWLKKLSDAHDKLSKVLFLI